MRLARLMHRAPAWLARGVCRPPVLGMLHSGWFGAQPNSRCGPFLTRQHAVQAVLISHISQIGGLDDLQLTRMLTKETNLRMGEVE